MKANRLDKCFQLQHLKDFFQFQIFTNFWRRLFSDRRNEGRDVSRKTTRESKKWMTEKMSEENFSGLDWISEKNRERFRKKWQTFSRIEISVSEVKSVTSEWSPPTSSTTTATASTTTTTTSVTLWVKNTRTFIRPRIRIGETATKTWMDFISSSKTWSTNFPRGKSSYSKIQFWIHQVKLFSFLRKKNSKVKNSFWPNFTHLLKLTRNILLSIRRFIETKV